MLSSYKTIRLALLSALFVSGLLAAFYIVRATADPHDRTFFDDKITGEKLEQQNHVSINKKYKQKERTYFENGWVEVHEYVTPKSEPGYLIYSGYHDGQNYFEKIDGEGPETQERTFDWRMVPTKEDNTASSTPIKEETTTSSTSVREDTTASSTPIEENTNASSTSVEEETAASSTPIEGDTAASSTPVEENTATSSTIEGDNAASSTPSL